MPQFDDYHSQAHFLKTERIKALAAAIEAVKSLVSLADAEDVQKHALRKLAFLIEEAG